MSSNPKLKALALHKENLRLQVLACSLGSDALLASIKAYVECSFDCLQERGFLIPASAEYVYATGSRDDAGIYRRNTVQVSAPHIAEPKAQRKARKLLRHFADDANWALYMLDCAVKHTTPGTRGALKAMQAKAKLQADFATRRSWLETNCTEKVKGSKKFLAFHEFVQKHGGVHIVAGHDRLFPSRAEAIEFADKTKEWTDHKNAMAAQNVPVTKKLIQAFEQDRYDEVTALIDKEAGKTDDNPENCE